MTDKEYVDFLTKCANIPYEDYSWLKDHCYRTLKSPCSPNTRNEHLAILDLIREHEERQWISISERLPNHDEYIENNGLFNVSDGNRSYSEWFDVYDTQRFGEPTMYGFRIDHAVTAWMPLPEPYKAESEEV